MTSKNSSSSSAGKGVSFWQLTWAAFRRNLWLPTLAMIGFFFTLPVTSALVMQRMHDYYDVGTKAQAIKNTMDSMLVMNQSFSTFIIAVGAVMAAVVLFYYLYRQKQVDFYHSLPIKRQKLFGINYTAGILVFLVPYVIGTLLNILVIVCFGNAGYMQWSLYFINIFSNILFFLLIYNVVVFAISLTGTMLISLKVAGVMLFIGPVLVLLYGGFQELFYPVSYQALFPLEQFLFNTSPVIKYIQFSTQGGMSGLAYAVVIGVALIFCLLALLLYCKRPSESAGNAIVFRHSKNFIKYPIVIVFAFVFAYFFYGIGDNSLVWMFFGAICGAFISGQLLEILYQFDFKAIKKGLPGIAVLTLLICLCLGGMAADITHFNTYVPAAAEVAKVNIYMDGVVHSQEELGYNNWQEDENWNSVQNEWQNLNRFAIEDPDAIAAVVQLADVAVELDDRWSNNSRQATEYDTPDYYNQNFTDFAVVYTMNDGKQVKRHYNRVPLNANQDLVQQIITSGEYQKGAIHLATADLSRTFWTAADDFQSISIDPHNFSEEEQKAIVSTFLAEYQAMDPAVRCQEMPVGSIDFTVYEETADGLSLNEVFRDDFNRDHASLTYTYPLYASNTQTIALLSAHDLQGAFRPRLSSLTSIDVWRRSGEKYTLGDDALVEADVTETAATVTAEVVDGETVTQITDAGQMAAIIKQTHPDQAFAWSLFAGRDESVRYTCHYQDFSEVTRYQTANESR